MTPISHLTLQPAHEYQVTHSRSNATFSIRVTEVEGEWIYGRITGDCPAARMLYSAGGQGERVALRAKHCIFTERGLQAASSTAARTNPQSAPIT